MMNEMRSRLLLAVKALLVVCCQSSQAQTVTMGSLVKPVYSFRSVELSPSSRFVVATISYSNDISIFEPYSGKEVQRLFGNENWIGAYLPDDSTVLRIGRSRIELVEVKNDSVLSGLEMPGEIHEYDFAQLGGKLLVRTADQVILVDCENRQLVQKQAIPSGQSGRISISPGGENFAVLSNNHIQCWETGRASHQSRIAVEDLLDFAVGDDWILVLKKSNLIALQYGFDGRPGTIQQNLRLIPKPYATRIRPFYNGFTFNTYGQTVFIYSSGFVERTKTSLDFHQASICGSQERILTWNASRIEITNSEGQLFARIMGQQIGQVSLLPDEKKGIVHAISESAISVGDGQSLKELFKFEVKAISVPAIAGNWHFIPFSDRSFQIFDASTQKMVGRFTHSSIPTQYVRSVNERLLYFVDLTQNTIYRLNIKSGEKTRIYHQRDLITALDLSSQGELILADEKGNIKRIRVEGSGAPSLVQEASILGDPITVIRTLPDGILAGSYGRVLYVPSNFSNSAGQKLLVGHNGFIQQLDTDPTGQILYSASTDQWIKTWDRQTLGNITGYKLDSGSVHRIVSPAEGHILFTGFDVPIGEIRDPNFRKVWKEPEQKFILQSPNNNAPLKLVINPTGNLLAAVDDNTVKVRDLRTGFLVSEVSTDNAIVNGICFSADGTQLVVASGEFVYCFDPYKGKLIRKIDLENTARPGTLNGGTQMMFNRSFHDIESYQNILIGFNVFGWHLPLVIHKNSGLKLFEFNFNTGKEFDNSILDLKCTPDGEWIATYGSGYVKIFHNKDSLVQKFVFPRLNPQKVPGRFSDYMCFSADKKYFLWMDIENQAKLRILDLGTGKIIKEHEGGRAAMGKNGQYLYARTKTSVYKAHVLNEQEEKLDFNWDDQVTNIVYSGAGDIYVISDNLGNIRTLDGRSGRLVNELRRWDQYTYSSRLSPDGKHLAFNNRWGLYLLDLASLKRKSLPADNYPFSAAFSPDGQTIYFRNGSSILSQQIKNGETDTIYNDDGWNKDFASLRISSGGEYLVVQTVSDDLHIINTRQKKNIFTFNRFTFEPGKGFVYNDGLNKNGKLVLKGVYIESLGDSSSLGHATLSTDGKFSVERLADPLVLLRKSKDEFDEEVFRKDAKVFELSPNGRYLALMKGLEFYVVEVNSRDTIFNRDNSVITNVVSALFDEKGNSLIIATSDGFIEIYNLAKKSRVERSREYSGLEQIGRFRANEMGITKIELSGNLLLVHGNNSFLTLYDIRTLRRKVDMVFIRDKDQLFIDSLGYYYASRDALPFVAFKRDSSIYSIDLLDIKFNRPDRVLQSVGSGDTLLIAAYRNAYYKRIRRQQLDTSWQPQLASIPECRLVDPNSIPFETAAEKVTLKLSMQAKGSNLSHLHVFVNNVPVYGRRGIPIKGKNRSSLDTSISVHLSVGSNKIEYSVSNNLGLESQRYPVFVQYNPAVQPQEKFWFIGVGIDQFAEPRYNLQYSSKDIRDLCLQLKEKLGDQLVIDTLFNQQVTIENVRSLRQKLQGTSIHDKVMIAYSGHGLLSKDFDYFLSTYAVNFEKPESGGLPYADLEDLVDGIPARKKLILLDACHSGEVDKEDLLRLEAVKDSTIKGLKPVAYKQEGQLGLKSSFELMQDLFINVGKNTGSTIISAAAGTQFALERGDLMNGVFTYCLLEVMRKNGSLRISKLKNTVSARVEEITGGLQVPTSRSESLNVDWELW